jgi:hypothetical protein
MSLNIFEFYTLNEIKSIIYHEVNHLISRDIILSIDRTKNGMYILENRADMFMYGFGKHIAKAFCTALIKTHRRNNISLYAEDYTHLSVVNRIKALGFNIKALEKEIKDPLTNEKVAL